MGFSTCNAFENRVNQDRTGTVLWDHLDHQDHQDQS